MVNISNDMSEYQRLENCNKLLSQCCLKSRFGTKQIVDEVYIYIYIICT